MTQLFLPLAILAVVLPWFLTAVHLVFQIVTLLPGGAL